MTALERFWAKVEPEPMSGCWIWVGARRHGYGAFHVAERVWPAHQFMYVQARGAIADGLEVDHRCRNTACVNPDHLEAVTHGENLRRGHTKNGVKTTCPNGHPYDRLIMEIGGPHRRCSICYGPVLRKARKRYRQRHA